MKTLARLFSVLALVGFASSAFAGPAEKEIENYVRAQIAKQGSDVSHDLLAKMADYDVRHSPNTKTAKASEYSIKAQTIGSGRGHYRHGPSVIRYLVTVDFTISRPAESFPVVYVLEVEKQTFDDGHIEFTSSEGQVF